MSLPRRPSRPRPVTSRSSWPTVAACGSGRALADIHEVLAREPRHFGALSGLGIILQELGDEKHALDVFRRALAIHPHLERIPEVQKAVEAADLKCYKRTQISPGGSTDGVLLLDSVGELSRVYAAATAVFRFNLGMLTVMAGFDERDSTSVAAPVAGLTVVFDAVIVYTTDPPGTAVATPSLLVIARSGRATTTISAWMAPAKCGSLHGSKRHARDESSNS